MSKLIVFTAPSGAGKTTIVRHLLNNYPNLAFSVSATTRHPRPNEKEGEDYYFMSPERFRQLIQEKAFIEWEEVYKDQYYGTLRSEIERLWQKDLHILFDIDVKGALSIKQAYPKKSLVIFVKPPSQQALMERLRGRKTEDPENVKKRLQKAAEELQYENRFDKVLVNDQLEKALSEAEQLVDHFLTS
jgi:guanylate kinase